ncbi:DUF1740-domain-containing protein [Thermothelomyces heterothallicus CBS 203.75]
MDKEQRQDKDKRRAVPKFGSFKPNPTPEPAPTARQAEEETQSYEDRHGRADKDSRSRDRDRDRREADRGHRRSSRERGRDRERDRSREAQGSRHREGHGLRKRDHERGGDRERDREWDRERERKREKDSERERHRSRHERHHTSRSRSPRNAPGRDRCDRAGSPVLSSNDLFVMDKRGDPLIVQYGSNDRSQVPVYHRFGGGRIIGSPGFLIIHRDGVREQFGIRLPGEGSGSGSAFRDKALVAAAARLRPRRIKPEPEPAHSARPPSEAFIPLSPPRKRKRHHDGHDEDGTHPPSPPDYRSTYGKARQDNLPSDSDSDSGSDSSPSRSPSPEPDPDLPGPRARAADLSRRVKTHPSDIPAWLELVALQDSLFASASSSFSSSSSPSSAIPDILGSRTAEEARSLAELKLSLYQEALPHAVSPQDRETLLLGMMREGARVWEEGVLKKKWEEVGSPDAGFRLWKARLNYETGRVAGFVVEQVREMIVGKLKALGRELERVAAGGREGDEELCRQLVYVFLRLTRLLHDAGFAELAVAAWQALLEMTFCRPPAEYAAEAALASFADFWEGEVARIGEDGARGWRHFVEAGEGMVDPPEPKSDKPSVVRGTMDPLKAWALMENQGAEKARMPARTLDEGTEDDPFRVVLFSDIKEFLVWFPSPVVPQVKPLLADAFLVFCGLPPAGLSGEPFLALLRDPFVAATGQGLDLGLGKEEAGTTTRDLTRHGPEFIQHGGSLAISAQVLFCKSSKFRYLEEWSRIYDAADKQVDLSWVLRTIGYLVRDCRMEALATYYLAMEWLNDSARARKVAKGLLKQYSSNIQLYNAYALVEWANGNAEVSHKVFSSATGLVQPLSSDGQLLWNTWAWTHLESGQKDLALARLCSSVDKEFRGPIPSPALLLTAKSQIASTRDYSLSSRQLGTAAQYAESLMLLEYLSAEGGSEPTSETQGNISAALSTIHAFSHELQSRNLHDTPHHERLLQSAACLLYHHATHGPYRPTYVREQLQTFVHLFPHNTLFLSLFAWSQPPLRIDDPVRAVLRTRALAGPPGPPHDRLGTRRFAIHHEARAGAGTAHSVRAAFEAALDDGDDGCRGSAELWVRYLRFCCSRRAELGRARAREVFYRAIGACPGAKEVYMEAFGEGMAGMLSAAELRAVVETMAEKGLRVHVDLDDFLQGRRGGEIENMS